MIGFRLQVDKEGLRRLQAAPDEMRKALIPAMKACMVAAEATAKKDYLSGPRPAKLQRVSGRLRGSIATEVRQDGNTVTGRIGSNVVYAHIHELGGVIRPKTATYLRFQIGGQWKSVKQVRMPARPFLRPALEDNMGRFREIFRRSLMEAFG